MVKKMRTKVGYTLLAFYQEIWVMAIPAFIDLSSKGIQVDT